MNRPVELEGIVENCIYERANTITFKIEEKSYFIDACEYTHVPIVNGMHVIGKAEIFGRSKELKVKEMRLYDKKQGKLLCLLSPKDAFGREK